MNFEFSENSVIIIPFVHKNCRLDDGEKVRFRCLFKNVEGDFPYTLDMEEDNKGEKGADGKYTISVDTATKGILPGRYQFDLSLVLASGALVTLKTKDECCVEIVPAAEGLYKPNGDVYFGADYVVEEGNSDMWTYRKWASGIAECWAKFDLDIMSMTEYGSVFVTPEIVDLQEHPFPFAFVDVPNVTEGLETARFSGILLSGHTHSTTHIGTYYIVSFVYISHGSVTIHFQVKGRWK